MDDRLRVLFVVPYAPNLVRVRPYNLIRSLTAIGHEVTVLTLVENAAQNADVAELAKVCHRVLALPLPRWRAIANCLAVLPTRTPLQAAYCWQPGLAGLMDEVLSGDPAAYDVVHVEHLRGIRYALHARQRGLPVIWDSVDSISLLFRQASQTSNSFFGRWVTRLELGRTEAYEAWACRQFERVLVTSQRDQEAFMSLVDRYSASGARPAAAQVIVLPNGVDLTYFHPPEPGRREPETLVVSGKMSYHANVTMVLYLAREVMPRIWSQRAGTRLMIVGKDPGREIRALAEDARITVTGTVPEIRPYLQQAAIAVAPLTYGVGIQNKVLEAMACGTPVVTTPQAIGSLQVTAGRDLLVGESTEEFAQATLALLADGERRTRVGQAGRRFVETHHNWLSIASTLADHYREARNQHRLGGEGQPS